MKVTKAEVREGLEALGAENFIIHLGTEKSGKMIVVAALPVFDPEVSQALSMVVMELAEKHGERYTPYPMSTAMFERYKVRNVFWEVAGVKPDVVKERWVRKHNEIKGQHGETLAVGINATNVELDKMAAAPQMLEALETIEKGNLLSGEGYIRIKALIKKARGEDA